MSLQWKIVRMILREMWISVGCLVVKPSSGKKS